MKRFCLILILLLPVFLFSCAGGNSAKKMPEHINAGMREITRGNATYNMGCYRESLDYFFRAHEFFTASDQLSGVAMSLNNIGNVYRIIGDIESAILFFDEAYVVYTDIDDNKGAVQVLSNKAAAMIDGKMLEEATNVLDSAENFAQKNKILFGPLLNNKGILFLKKKEYRSAEEILQKVLAKADPKNFSEFATVNFALGDLMLETQRYEKAIAFFKSALTADRLSGFYKGIADDLAAIGSAYLLLKEDELALNFYKRSVKIYALIGDQKKVRSIMEMLDKMSEKTGLSISVTKHFVIRWLEGKAFESPCK
jgi:tetratricopeptide (TPR) repeat protein